MLFRNTTFLRSLAAFLIVEMIINVVSPAISYALTAGPSSPEFSSFEPVDTTDVVNLATGEFVYNTPVLEVPGPEGGYPLSLSYHAGIKVEQEASWVGLGFTLNPGAINRTVNGFADDNLETQRQVRDYWGGGEAVTKTFNLGISAYGISANYSIARTTDTYKGVSTRYASNTSMDPISVGLYIAPVLQGQHLKNMKAKQGENSSPVQAKTNYGPFTAKYFTITSLTGRASIGFTIDSRGISTNASIAGIAIGQKNNYAGQISSFTNSAGGAIMSVGYSEILSATLSQKDYYTRYWSDESQAQLTYGSLYPGIANEKIGQDHYAKDLNSEFVSYASDVYDIHNLSSNDSQPPNSSVVDDINDPTRQVGGTLPAYDRFDVLGQGIGGTIQPYTFENGDLFGQSYYERGLLGEPVISFPIVEYKSMKKFSKKKLDFRFLNDFSNALTITPPTFQENTSTLDGNTINTGAEGFNNDDCHQKLAGSKHIEWFTNEDIVNGTATQVGFIDAYHNRYDRKLVFQVYDNYLQPEAGLPYSGLTYGKGEGSFTNDTYQNSDPFQNQIEPEYHSLKPRNVDLSKKIGGFMITNESGVTYHYGLPAYNYNEYTKTKVKKTSKGTPTFREFKNDEPYAYTWLLTAITGPDFVDRGFLGELDDEDWGYWVKFDYGRWADAYQWRTPHSGYIDDIENNTQAFSYGIKELYYLDAIETRTHKALFIKSKKKDGKGVTSRLEGGSNPRFINLNYRQFGVDNDESGNLPFSISPVSTMKLDAIYLFDKKALEKIPLDKARGKKYNEATSKNPYKFYYSGDAYQYQIPYTHPKKTVVINNLDHVVIKYHNGYLVYDDGDIRELPQVTSDALRIVKFNTDYSLGQGPSGQGVPNSFGYFSDLPRQCLSPSYGECEKPETDFDFEWPLDLGHGCGDPFLGSNLSSPFCCNSFIDNEALDGSYDRQKGAFYSNDPLQRFGYRNTFSKCSDADKNYRGDKVSYWRTGKLTLKSIKFLGRGGADLLPSTTFEYAKNPQYVKEKYDEWGYYKSDYNSAISGHTRRVTPASAVQVDAWSLTSIGLPMGANIEIEYEPHEFSQSVYLDFDLFSIEQLLPSPDAPQDVKIIFRERSLNLQRWFSVGNAIEIKTFLVYKSLYHLTGNNRSTPKVYDKDTDIITSIGENFLTISSAELRELLTKTQIKIATKFYPCVTYFVAGFIKTKHSDQDTAVPKYSGGVRVASLAVVSGHTGTNKTVYQYSQPGTNLSSGVTAYTPFNIPSITYPTDDAFFNEKGQQKNFQKFQSNFQTKINSQYTDLLVFLRESPPPGVIYGYVTQRSYVDDRESDAYTISHFRVFNKQMISRESADFSSDSVEKRLVTIKNNAIDVGNLLSTQIFTSQSNIPLQTTSYGYLYGDEVEPFEVQTLNSRQGIIEQSFHKNVVLTEYKFDYEENNWTEVTIGGKDNIGRKVSTIYSKEKALITKKNDRSNVVTSVVQTDHKTGITSSTQNHAFDFYTGQVTKAITSDSYGNIFMAVTEPAYKHYGDMGLKIYSPGNKHMLTQEGAAYVFKVDPQNEFNPTGMISASIQTWTNKTPVVNLTSPQLNVWRKHASYQWNGITPLDPDGSYSYSDFMAHPFDWTEAAPNPTWEKVSEVMLYDYFSRPIEMVDINGNYSSSRLDRNHKWVIANSPNAKYHEIASSGAEFYSGNTDKEGGVSRGEGSASRAEKHTGEFSLLVPSGKSGFTYILNSETSDLTKPYKASVWVHAPGESETQTELDKLELFYSINGKVIKKVSPTIQKSKANSWYQLNIDIIPDGLQEISIGVRNNALRDVYFDDFRVHPANTSVNAYVYNSSTGELDYILDGNNFYTHFEYDAIGRLVRSSKELLNFDFGEGKESIRLDAILNEVKYNYGKPN